MYLWTNDGLMEKWKKLAIFGDKIDQKSLISPTVQTTNVKAFSGVSLGFPAFSKRKCRLGEEIVLQLEQSG